METLTIIAEKHNEWVGVVRSFGCNKETAEDIVQEMYIKLHRIIESGTDIMYNETEVNYYYVLRTLRSLFIDLKRKEKNISFIDIDELSDQLDEELIDLDYEKIYQIVQDELDNLHWYDQKVYEIIEGGESIMGLSEKSKISYYSLYNTYKKVIKQLKQIIKKEI